MKKLVVIGAGGHSRAVISTAIEQQEWDIQGVVDISYHQQEEDILGVPVVGGVDLLSLYNCKEIFLAVAIGDNDQRKSLIEEIVQRGFDIPNIVHPSAHVSRSVTIGTGNYIGPMAHLGPCVTIGNGNIINTHANIEHETVIGSYNHIAPSSVLCGRVCVEEQVLVGANATVLDGRCIVEKATIGAGSVITKNIVEQGLTVVGVPGREV